MAEVNYIDATFNSQPNFQNTLDARRCPINARSKRCGWDMICGVLVVSGTVYLTYMS